MKIVHVIEATATGTLAMVCLLANEQKSAGHEVTVMYSVRPESPADLLHRFSSGICLINVQMITLWQRIFSLWKIGREITKKNYDIAFFHSSLAGFLGRVSLLIFRFEGGRLYIPHCISFMRRDVGWLKRRSFVFLERFACLSSATYLACSRSEMDLIVKELPSAKCVLVENSIDLSDFLDSQTAICSDQHGGKTVVTVGHIREQKGPKLFAAIAKIAKINDPDINFVWIGDGTSELREVLCSAGVKITGWLPRKLVIEKLRQANCYLSTAQWEGMPVAVLEAMYTGIPVVASECSGNIDVVEHGRTGYLFSEAEVAVKYIESVISDPSLGRGLAKLALQEFELRFKVDVYVKKIEDIMETSILN